MGKKFKDGVSVIVPAAGNSTRMGGINKQMLLLENIPVLVHTLRRFSNLDVTDEIIVVTRASDIKAVQNMIDVYNIPKIKKIIPGGNTRQESVFAGLKSAEYDKVLIHDGARPMITADAITALIESLKTYRAAALGVPSKDTVKRVDKNGKIVETLDRKLLVCIQTPQGFDTELIINAHMFAKEQNIQATDDCMLAEAFGADVYVIPGEYSNIKITTQEDVFLCEEMLRQYNHSERKR